MPRSTRRYRAVGNACEGPGSVRLVTLASIPANISATHNVLRNDSNPKAMALVLKARRLEVYASSAPALKAEAVEQLFAHLRNRLPPETYQQVVQACESFTEPKSLGRGGARQ